jgi:7-cyano-7-deazaguanine tRNA-ribosyltransferase
MEIEKIKELQKIRIIADYQFGMEAGSLLFPEEVKIVKARTTGRIRRIMFGGDLLATLRPTDGLFSLSVNGAKRLSDSKILDNLKVVVMDSIQEFIRSGRSVFAKHVINASKKIRPYDEVIVVNQRGDVLACGRALLSGEEMCRFKIGVAVRVRTGNKKNNETFKRKHLS